MSSNEHTPVEISITLVNWNTKDVLLDCLQSIVDNPPSHPYDIWLVDNGSVDGSAQAVRERFPQVQLIANSQKQPFSVANNRIIQLSTGRYIVYQNVDTIVHPGLYDKVYEYLETHPDVGAVGPRTLNKDGTLQRSCWRGVPGLESALIESFYLWKWLPRFASRKEVNLSEHHDPLVVDHLLGSFIAVPRRVIEDVGMLDESYPLYFLETEWCIRIQQGGYKIVYLPEAEITHLGQQTQRKYPIDSLRQLYEGQCHFIRATSKRWAGLRVAALKLILASGVLLRLGVWGMKTIYQRDLGKGMLKGYISVLRHLPAM
ncbi:MAG: glycosyltransferase family 2 protein [Candidatus Brachytrichaceae bacterium NZ_4S206]|jgi:GT2 family glycosyltransferase